MPKKPRFPLLEGMPPSFRLGGTCDIPKLGSALHEPWAEGQVTLSPPRMASSLLSQAFPEGERLLDRRYQSAGSAPFACLAAHQALVVTSYVNTATHRTRR